MLFIDNEQARELLTAKDCVEVQEKAFASLETGEAMHRPRVDMYTPCEREDGYFRWGTMEGYNDGMFAIRMKSDIILWPKDAQGGWTEDKYCIKPGTYCGLVMLFSAKNAEPLAFFNDSEVSRYRVGAGAGIGAKYLAKKESKRVGILGSGGMARAYLEAFCSVRPIESCMVFSPTKANREKYAREMSEQLKIEVVPVDSAEEAVRGSDIVASCTDTMLPTIRAEWLSPGMHITDLNEEDIADDCLSRIDLKFRQGEGGLPLQEGGRIRRLIGHSPVAYIAGTDEEMKRLPGKPKQKHNKIEYGWPNYCDLIYGRAKGREDDSQITFYHNFGNQGLQFSSVCAHLYRTAIRQGIGRLLPTDWFLQKTR